MIDNDSGIAPALGLIVMILITIGLAAVVSYFVFSMSGTLTGGTPPKPQSFTATVTIKEASGGRFIDIDGKGYVYGGVLTPGLIIGKMYDITFVIDQTTHERRISNIEQNVTSPENPYVCTVESGVCK